MLIAGLLTGCGGDSNSDLVRRNGRLVSESLLKVAGQLEAARTTTGAYPAAAEVLAATDLPAGVVVTVWDSSPVAYCLHGNTTQYPYTDLFVVERQDPFTIPCLTLRSGNQTPEQDAQQRAARDAEHAAAPAGVAPAAGTQPARRHVLALASTTDRGQDHGDH